MMATIHIPAAMRKLTEDRAVVTAPGATLGEVIDNLETTYPGLKERLVEGERARSNLAVFVDGAQVFPFLNTKVNEDSEVYFALAIAGG
jgi:molybdopterin converting factor small subunit